MFLDSFHYLWVDLVGNLGFQFDQQRTGLVTRIAQSPIGQAHDGTGLGSGLHSQHIFATQYILYLDFSAGYQGPDTDFLAGREIQSLPSPTLLSIDTESHYQVASTGTQSWILHMIAIVYGQRYVDLGTSYPRLIADGHCALSTQCRISQRNPQCEPGMGLASLLLPHMIKNIPEITEPLESWSRVKSSKPGSGIVVGTPFFGITKSGMSFVDFLETSSIAPTVGMMLHGQFPEGPADLVVGG